jgi:predicted esterase
MHHWLWAALGAIAGAVVAGAAKADTPAIASGEVHLAPGSRGALGAWLVSSPFESPRLPDEGRMSPHLGPGWRLVSASDGPLDVALDGAPSTDAKSDRTAYAGGVLRLAQGGRHYLLLGADDGLAVVVDGKRIFARDEARPLREDDDLVALDLGPGDHTVVLVLHQVLHPRSAHARSWSFRARLLDAQLQPPAGASWTLPGTSAEDARALAARMSSVSLDRGMVDDGYRPVLTVRFPQGAPRDVHLDVHARLVRASGGAPLVDVDVGEVGIGDRAVLEMAALLPHVAGDEVEDDDWTAHVEVAGRGVDLPFHPRKVVREAVARAGRGLAKKSDESVEHLRDRLAAFVAQGDADVDAQLDDARELDAVAATLDEGKDPWLGKTGPMRRAYTSPADGKPSEFALYVPPDFDPSRKYPLIVALHGMNGHPMQMLMWLFGHDDPMRDGNWEDRHPRRELEHLPAIVVAPDGHFNAMYRDLGEADVMRVTDWVTAHYPVDEARVTITGPSMGGIGTAACALHHPDRFAAAEPLCGYHSYFVRGDIGGARMRPWEHFIAEQRSNVLWAENGLYIPMFVVHGTKDLPEENSKVLIDRYIDLGYAMKHEHPELGHNVWQTTYEGLKGARWLLWHQRPLHPRAVRFKTPSTRWADDAWVHVREMAASDQWGEITARIDKDNGIHVSTRGVADLALDRDAERIDDAAPVTVSIDQSKLVFQAGEGLEAHRQGAAGAWKAGPATHAGVYKHGAVTGPMRDVLHGSVLFVWGASDPAQARANEDAARGWARVRGGVHVDFPVMSDAEFYARGEALANEHALFLVGNARSNRVVRELEPAFPIRIEGDDVVLGTKHLAPKEGTASRSQLGVAFIRPNPRRADRYVVVVEGVGALGTWRSLSLPDMLPDFVVFDEDVAPARGALLLGAGTVRAGGFFTSDWSLPSTL